MRTVSSRASIAAILLSVPLVLGAQKPQKPPKPGGSAPNPAIAFEARNNSDYFDLMVMDADGKNLTRLVRGGDNLTPSWSPDGEWIAFARTYVAKPGIYLVRRDGTGLCRVVSLAARQGLAMPTWSPRVGANGGYMIVYADYPEGASRPDLFAVDARCGDNVAQNLTNTPELGEGAPAWAADDRLAAAIGGSGYENDIQVFEIVAGAGGISLSPGMSLSVGGPIEAANKWGPAWSPDRSVVVVLASLETPPGSATFAVELWALSTDGSGQAARLTDSPDVFESPARWSPGGAHLAFDGHQQAIYRAAVGDGGWSLGAPTVLAVPPKGYTGVARPSWRPVP